MTGIDVGRRSFVAAVGALSATSTLAAASSSARGPARASLDPAVDLPMMYRKLRYSMDEDVVMWWFAGTKYGQRDGEFTPLYKIETCNWNRVKNEPDGGFTITVLECAFYTDLQSGEVLRTWKNPYTNQVVTIPYAIVGPLDARHDAQSQIVPLSEIGGAKVDMRVTIGPVTTLGDDVWTETSNRFAIHPRSGGRPHVVYEWATYTAKATDLANRGIRSLVATCDLQDMTAWPRWMNMGDQPGGVMGRISGRKVSRFEEMPAGFRARLAQVFPDVVKDPIAALDKPTEKLQR